MNEKGKEWIGKNIHRIMLRLFPFFVVMLVIITFLQIWGLLITNEDMLRNIFVTITCFGAIIFIIQFLLYTEKWSDSMMVLVKEYKEYVGDTDARDD